MDEELKELVRCLEHLGYHKLAKEVENTTLKITPLELAIALGLLPKQILKEGMLTKEDEEIINSLF